MSLDTSARTTDARITIDHVMMNKDTNAKNRINGNSIRRYPTTACDRSYGFRRAIAKRTILRKVKKKRKVIQMSD